MNRQLRSLKLWRKNTKERIVKSLGGCCQICGFDEDHEKLCTHHMDPDAKEFNIGEKCRAWSKVVVELRKCTLLCRPCHVKVHKGILTVPESAARFDESYADYRTRKDNVPS